MTYTPEHYELQKQTGERRANGSMVLKKLRRRHWKVIELHLRGVKNSVIADTLEITPARVSIILNDPLALKVIAQFVESSKARLHGLFSEALDVVQDGLTAENKSGDALYTTRLRAADMVFKLRQDYQEDKDAVETAEDVIQRVLQVGVQVNINTEGPAEAQTLLPSTEVVNGNNSTY